MELHKRGCVESLYEFIIQSDGKMIESNLMDGVAGANDH